MRRMANSKLSKKMTLRQFDHGYWYGNRGQDVCASSRRAGRARAAEGRARESHQALPDPRQRNQSDETRSVAVVHVPIRLAISAQSLAGSAIDARCAHHLSRSRQGVRPPQSSGDDVPATTRRSVLQLPQRLHPGATMAAGIRAWKTVKRMDAPKNYTALTRTRGTKPGASRQRS